MPSRTQRIWTATTAATAVSITLWGLAPAAQASPDVVADCDDGAPNGCVFLPSDAPFDNSEEWDTNEYQFDEEQVFGDQREISDGRVTNCSNSDGKYSLKVGLAETDTISTTTTAEVSAGLKGIVETSLSFSLGTSYSTSKSRDDTYEVTLKPGETGYLTETPEYLKRSGKLGAHYEDRVDDHYYWTKPISLSEYVGGNTQLQGGPATEEELDNCATPPQNDGGPQAQTVDPPPPADTDTFTEELGFKEAR